jgi:hypothetical protein
MRVTPILNEVSHLFQVASELGSSSTPTVGNLMDLRNRLLDARSRFLDVNENRRETVRGVADIDKLVDSIDQTIEQSLSPDGKEAWLKATAISKDLKETYENPSSIFYHAVRTDNPSTLTDEFADWLMASPTPERVRELRERMGDEGVGITARCVSERLLGRTETGEYDLENLGRRLELLPDEFREELFGKHHEQLRRIATDYRNLRYNNDGSSSIFYHAATTDNPSTLPGEFADWLMASPTPERVRELRARIGDEGVGAIARAVMEKLLGRTEDGEYDFLGYPDRLENLNRDFCEELFGSGHQRLRDIAITSRVLTADNGRSKSSKGLQKRVEIVITFGALIAAVCEAWAGHPWAAALTIAVPLLYHAGQYGLARLMTSPRFTEWLMTPKQNKP